MVSAGRGRVAAPGEGKKENVLASPGVVGVKTLLLSSPLFGMESASMLSRADEFLLWLRSRNRCQRTRS